MIRPYIFFLVLLFSGFLSYSQNQDEKVPLQSFLDSISAAYDVNFNFADETIRDIYITAPPQGLSIDDLLEYLSLNSSLQFSKLNDTLISIVPEKPGPLNICGHLIDSLTEQPIAGASIIIKNQMAVSDSKGYFELNNVAVNEIITVRSLGYEISSISSALFPGSANCLEIFMIPNVTRLKEVIISNFMITGIDINSDGAIIIESRILGILPGLIDPDVLQTLQALPGIHSINETVSDINVRGGTNDQNLIYWDGIKMYQSGHFFGLITAFNPYITEEVILVKNGTSASMSDGVSSTILVLTNDETTNQIEGSAGINMINADINLKMPLSKKLSVELSGRRSISDLIETPTYEQYFNRIFRNTDVTSTSDTVNNSEPNANNQFVFYDFTSKIVYDISPKDKVNANFIRIYNQIEYEESATVGNEIETKNSGLEQGSMASQISYQRQWNEKINTGAQIYFSNYLINAINYDVQKNQRLTQENEILDTGIKLDSRFKLNDQNDLFLGYQFFEVGISNLDDINNPPYRRLIKRVLRTHAMFLEGNVSSKSGYTHLRLGLRANYFEKFNKFSLEPRLAFNQRFLRNFTFELLGEIKNQTTTQVIDLQDDFLGVEKRRWILADEEDIPIVTSRQVSTGFRFQQGDFLASIMGYWKSVNDISTWSQGFQNQFQYVKSIGSYEVKGLDFLINQKFGHLSAWLSYSLGYNQYDFPELSPSVFPNNLDIRHTATFAGNYQADNFEVSAGINWRTGKPYTMAASVEAGNIIYEDPNSSRLDDYVRFDLSGNYSWNFSSSIHGELGISIWNLLNTENIVNIYYQIDDNNNLITVEQKALGFTPNLSFRILF